MTPTEAQLRALVAKWRNGTAGYLEDGRLECADDLEKALDAMPSDVCPECTGVPDGAFTKGYCERCGAKKRASLPVVKPL